jgi:phage terminase large subunit-like protein
MYRYQGKGNPLNPIPKEFQMAREGLLVTNEYGLAKHLLSIIKDEIENNEILRSRLMPDSKREGWGAEKIMCRNGASLAIKSANSKIRGYHPTYIILDDFLNESSLYSQDQRDKYWNTFSGVLLPALSPGGQMLIVGTPFFEKDMYAQLKETKKFKVFEYPAVFPDGTLLFPQRHTFASLMEKKSILGSLIFSREILVKPISDAASIFPYDILRRSIKGQDSVDLVMNIDSSYRKFVKIVVGCDFAISSGAAADYSVFTILGVDELGIFHVLNCWRKKGANYGQQIGALKKINSDFRPDLMYAEDNGMQEIFIQMMEDANLPVVGKTTNAVNKKSLYFGVPSLAVLFETGRIKFPYGSERAKNLTDLYFGELNSITYIQKSGKLESVSQHDDCGMSLWNAVRAAKGGTEDFDFSFI